MSGRLYDLMVRAMPLAKILKVACSHRRLCFIYRNTNRERSRTYIEQHSGGLYRLMVRATPLTKP